MQIVTRTCCKLVAVSELHGCRLTRITNIRMSHCDSPTGANRETVNFVCAHVRVRCAGVCDTCAYAYAIRPYEPFPLSLKPETQKKDRHPPATALCGFWPLAISF
jgi:hypothetical protein